MHPLVRLLGLPGLKLVENLDKSRQGKVVQSVLEATNSELPDLDTLLINLVDHWLKFLSENAEKFRGLTAYQVCYFAQEWLSGSRGRYRGAIEAELGQATSDFEKLLDIGLKDEEIVDSLVRGSLPGDSPEGHESKREPPLIAAPGFDVKPFVPSYEWIEETVRGFYSMSQTLRGEDFSFSTAAFGVYRVPARGFNYGLSAGKLVASLGEALGWSYKTETIDGIGVVTCRFDYVNFGEKEVEIQGTRCRAACVEPWRLDDGFNFYYVWLGKKGSVKLLYDQKGEGWVE